MSNAETSGMIGNAAGAHVPVGHTGPAENEVDVEQTNARERILALLDQLEGASPAASASLAEEVRKEASQLRYLKRR